jgi:hypothetical protein
VASLKYEEVYLKDYESVTEARAGIERYFRFYNQERLHQACNTGRRQRSGWRENDNASTRNKQRSIVELGDSVPEPLGCNAFWPEYLLALN